MEIQIHVKALIAFFVILVSLVALQQHHENIENTVALPKIQQKAERWIAAYPTWSSVQCFPRSLFSRQDGHTANCIVQTRENFQLVINCNMLSCTIPTNHLFSRE